MIIPINIASTSSNPKLPPSLAKISHDELVLIELQGSLEVESSHIGGRDGKIVGKLKIDEAINKPTLLIGHHLLEGKIANLPKPLAVLLRSESVSPVATVDVTDGEAEYDQEGGRSEITDVDERSPGNVEKKVEWDVVAVVKRKIVFSKRPMPIVNLGPQPSP